MAGLQNRKKRKNTAAGLSGWLPDWQQSFVRPINNNNNNNKYLFIPCKFNVSCPIPILNSSQFSNQMLVFEERGKPEYPEKNL